MLRRSLRFMLLWLAGAHDTWGVADKCTASASAKFFKATPALADVLARGHVVVATDFEGLDVRPLCGRTSA